MRGLKREMKRPAKEIFSFNGNRAQAGKLENISIVLVEPRGAGNIGSTARAMKNNGLSDLVLVNPCDYNNDECLSMACNATEIVRGARVFGGLKEAISGFGFVAATTRRLGKVRDPVLNLHEAVPGILEMARKNNVAVLFGREDRGLKNIELELCNILFELPAHGDYPSLNLSHAVFLLAHHLFVSKNEFFKDETIEAAPMEEVEKMYVHMEEALRALEYGDKGGGGLLKLIKRNFRKILGRTALMPREVNMLRGIFSQIICRVDPSGRLTPDEKTEESPGGTEETGS